MNKIMVDKVNVRSMAISAIDLISSQKAFSTEIINANINKINNTKDEFLYRELVYGTIENLFYIDYMINKVSKIKTNKMENLVLNSLRPAFYELVFLRIENYATVNEYVKIVKRKKGLKTGNFVNAILRNAIRKLDEIQEIQAKDKLEYLSIKHSFNEDLVKYLFDNYGIKEAEKIILALCQKPQLSIRVNTMLTTLEDLKAGLISMGFEVKTSKLAKDTLIIDNPSRITEFDEFKKGYFTIQDQASIKVSEVLNPDKNSKILDLCAAPGSKSSHLAQISEDKSLIISNDISKEKLGKIKENFDRMGLKNYEITNYDACETIEDFVGKFDYILVDAPCSGLGVIKRKPEIKLFRSLEEIKSLANIQKQILNNSLQYLKNGGFLVYSTCTLGNLENQDVIKDFMSKNPSVNLINIGDENYLDILPYEYESDGFFMAKFTKV